jgi:hypothetical protein
MEARDCTRSKIYNGKTDFLQAQPMIPWGLYKSQNYNNYNNS